jgi:hypothetical protein
MLRAILAEPYNYHHPTSNQIEPVHLFLSLSLSIHNFPQPPPPQPTVLTVMEEAAHKMQI